MPAQGHVLDDVAAAVLDGKAADWTGIESTAWGHLRVLERIGRGSSGDVFRAWDTRLDREVVLKLLPATSSPAADDESSIVQRARLLARVGHPNVLTIYGAERIDGRVGLWMELVRGRTLEQLLAEGRVFHPAEIVEIGLGLCRALSAVHAAGVLHRNIQPHNVTRTDDGRVVLMDFGAGGELGDDSSSALPGTPLYLAPEVLAGRPATVQSDIYSLGMLLYQVATRSYPVTGRTMAEVRPGRERGHRLGVPAVQPRLTKAVSRVVERACAVEPQRRYDTVSVLARDLSAVRENPGSVPYKYGLVAAVAACVAVGAMEVRARWTADPPTLASRSDSVSVSSGFSGAGDAPDPPVPRPTAMENEPGGVPSDRSPEKPQPPLLFGSGQVPVRILIDASGDGGGWWFPQGASGEFLAAEPHQGKRLADHLRQSGADVEERPSLGSLSDMGSRRYLMTTPEMLSGRDLVVWVGGYLEALPEETAAYRDYVAGGGKLLLLADYRRPTQGHSLAESFGVELNGISRGENTITRFVSHPLTRNVKSVRYIVGSGVVAAAENVTVLGHLSPRTYLDLNDNKQKDDEEPVAAAALGVLRYGAGEVVFLGDTNALQELPQPLTDNIFRYLLND